MKGKNMTEQDWIVIGDQAKLVREELFKLMSMCYGTMPKTTYEPLGKSVKYLDDFKCQAEDRMFRMRHSEREDIFYGEREDK